MRPAGWLRDGRLGVEAISAFSQVPAPRREKAIERFLAPDEYIYALNHDQSLKGNWRRLRFALEYKMNRVLAVTLRNPPRMKARPGSSPAHLLMSDRHAPLFVARRLPIRAI